MLIIINKTKKTALAQYNIVLLTIQKRLIKSEKKKQIKKDKNMPEEWVCDECGYVGTNEGTCPECGSKLVSVGDYDDDLAKSEEKYSKDEMEVEGLEEDLDLDDEEEDEK